MLVGYARVSSVGQSLDVQLDALSDAGCEKIFAEKRSGTTMLGRTELSDALSFVREGDMLVVTRLDRLARSAGDLHALIKQLTDMGCGFDCLQQPGMCTTSSTGKLMVGVTSTYLDSVKHFQKEYLRLARTWRGSTGWKWRSSTPLASPGSRDS